MDARSSEVTLDMDGLERALVAICSMSRDELCSQLHAYPATFPLDFTDAWLATQSTDLLRHLVARLVLHCRKPLCTFSAAA